jgi:hypothetical protein
VFEIDYWNLNFTPPKLETLTCAAAKFGYRDSIFKQALCDKAVITAVRFRLQKQADVKVAYGDILAELTKQQAPQPYTPQSVANAVIAQRLSKLPNPDELGNHFIATGRRNGDELWPRKVFRCHASGDVLGVCGVDGPIAGPHLHDVHR